MTHYVEARNYASESENRIHSDEIARKYGFTGALVPGVTVYGYLTRPLVEAHGADWLTRSVADVRLFKPTYDGDRVAVDLATEGDIEVARVTNGEGTVLAELRSSVPDPLPAPEGLEYLDGAFKHPERVEIAWDTVEPRHPFVPWTVRFAPEENARYTTEARDDLPLYEEAVHPHWLLAIANTALVNEYVMPAWIHVSSETRHRALLRVGDEIVVKSVPLEKFVKKGHEFVRLLVTFWRGDELTTDILHTAIFKVAE